MNISLETFNQLKTLLIQSDGAQTASVQIWFRAGSALEKSDHFGIAHFLEHMFFKGTKKRPDNGPAKEVDGFGGEFNAFTSFDYTCYYINCPAAYLAQSTDILIDMVSNPLFLEKDLPAERSVVHEEYKRSYDSASHYHFHQIQHHSFAPGYQHQILGTEKNISQFSIAQLNHFRNSNYSISNCMLVIAGDLNFNDQKKNIIEIISAHRLPKGEQSSFPSFYLQNSATPIWVHNKATRLATLTIAIPGVDYLHSQAAAEELALSCLGSGESSVLHSTIVKDQNLCTGISASSMFFNHGGLHLIKAVFPLENLASFLKSFTKILQQTYVKGISAFDTEKIKNQYIASKIYEQESIESLAFSFGHSFAQSDNINSEKEFIEKISHCSSNAVHSQIKQIFSSPWHYHLQLPLKIKTEQHAKSLKIFDQNRKKFFNAKSSNLVATSKPLKSTPQKSFSQSSYDKNVIQLDLAPGVQFIYRQNTQCPTFVLQAYIKGGLSDESINNNGIYHMLSRTLTSGYGKLNYLKLKKDLDFKSAQLSGFSGKNSYGLMLHGLTKDYPALFSHFTNSLFNPTISPKILAGEKKIILRILDNQKEDPVKACFQLFHQYIYKNTPYSLEILGHKKSIQSFSSEQLKKLHQENLKRNPITIAYFGNQPFDEIFAQLKNSFSHLKARPIFKVSDFKLTSTMQSHPLTQAFDREQTHLFVGYIGFPLAHKNNIYLKLLTAYLSGQSSELFLEMRDRQGLCYTVQAVHNNALQAGHWGIYMATSTNKQELALKTIKNLLENFANTGVKPEEFRKLKSMLKGQQALSLQTNGDFAPYYSIPVLYQLGLDYEWKQAALIEQCSIENFNHFVNKYLKSPLISVIVGK